MKGKGRREDVLETVSFFKKHSRKLQSQPMRTTRGVPTWCWFLVLGFICILLLICVTSPHIQAHITFDPAFRQSMPVIIPIALLTIIPVNRCYHDWTSTATQHLFQGNTHRFISTILCHDFAIFT